MVNDIKVVDPLRSLLVKFADDLTLSVPVGNCDNDIPSSEALNILTFINNS